MDKYEYNVKLEEINQLVNEENYEEAARVADTIEWKRVRNVRTLCMVSEIYEADGRLEDSKEILLRAYRRSPNVRAILYRLVEICVKLKEFDDAVEFYTQYVQSAPNDNSRYILKYKIYKGRGSSLEDQINILEEYKNKEYTEKWAYELAKLYQRADMPEKCVEACDDLALWFHNGKYVIKALELKKNYAELTPEQQHVYDQRNNMQEDEEVIEEALLREQREKEELPKLEKEIVKKVTGQNLADNIIAATEKEIAETVMQHHTAETKNPEMESAAEQENFRAESESQDWDMLQKSAKLHTETVNKVLEDAAKREQEEREKFARRFNTAQLQEELAKSMRQIVAGIGRKQEDLVESSNIVQPSEKPVMQQEEAEVMTEEQKQRAASIDDILTSFGSEETAAATQEEEQKKDQRQECKEEKDQEEKEATLSLNKEKEREYKNIEEPKEEAETDGKIQEEIHEKEAKPEPQSRRSAGDKTEKFEPVRRENILVKETENEVKEEAKEESRKEERKTTGRISEEIDLSAAIEAAAGVLNLRQKEPAQERQQSQKNAHQNETEPVRIQKTAREEAAAKQERIPQQTSSRKTASKVSGNTAPKKLNSMQRYYFPFFSEIPLLNEQIAVALDNAKKLENDKTSRKGNIIILGNRGSGRSTIGFDIAKALSAEKNVSVVKVAKIYAADLNKKDIPATIEKIAGGVLIIEEAGDLNDTVIETLTKAMDFRTDGLVIILEDEPKYISDMLKHHPDFAEKFNSKIVIPIFTNEELLLFGKIYALDHDYCIADGAEEELYNRIREGQTDPTQPSTIQNVKKILDGVMKKVEKGGLRKIKMGFSKKRYDEEDRVLLFDKDFR
ncbi:MAG: tetratricopeptide repeat protein [Eubacteriales bacterium]|nr:tetratricopeptide repeat protein [Eubacteriales bacterium]